MTFASIDTRAYREDETVFFIRIKGHGHFFDEIYGRQQMERLFGHISRPRTISEYRNADHYIDLNRYALDDMTTEDWDIYYACVHADLPAIIARCRGLRATPFAEAKELVLRMVKWSVEFFRQHRYRLLVINIIDNYVLDVLCRVARHSGAGVLGLGAWFVQPYRRHTLYGELHKTRIPAEEEVDELERYFAGKQKVFRLERMSRRERLAAFGRLYLRYRFLYVTRYAIRHKLLGDNAYEFRFANVVKLRLRDLFVGRYFGSVSRQEIEGSPGQFVALPLHVFPEASVDYWMADYRHADYYTSVYEAISFFRDRGMTVLVKEHPAFLFQRDTDVYRTLRSFGNVRLIDPFSDSAAAFDLVSLVLVWHGTAGIEALMHGKRVVAFDSNHYSEGVIPPYRDFEQAEPLTPERRRPFLRELLAGVERV